MQTQIGLYALLIAGPTLAQEVEEAPAEEAPTEEAPVSTPIAVEVEVAVALDSGLTLRGTAYQADLLVWVPGEALLFTPAGGTPTTLPGSKIVGIGQPGQADKAVMTAAQKKASGSSDYQSPKGFSVPNPAASRYLYAPSSINMKAGQGYVSQKLVFTSVAYAPSDNFTLIFGTFTPFPPLLTVFGAKTSFQINENLHASFGGEAFVLGLNQEVPLALGFGALTWGHEDAHVTVATGLSGGSFFDSMGIPILFGGQWRSSHRVAFITENWAILNVDDLSGGNAIASLDTLIASAAIRLVGRRDFGDGMQRGMRTHTGHPRTTWDLGFIALALAYRDGVWDQGTGEWVQSNYKNWEILAPMPWIDWTWHFGEAKK